MDIGKIEFAKYDAFNMTVEQIRKERGLPSPLKEAPPMPECKEPKKTIVFNSQEEFENAVMEVVLKRLQVKTSTYDLHGRKITDYPNKSICIDKEDVV